MEPRKLLELPSELLLQILCYLDVKDILHCEIICKLFRDFLQGNTVWKTIYKSHLPTLFAREKNLKDEPVWRDCFIDKYLSKPKLNHILILLNLFTQYLNKNNYENLFVDVTQHTMNRILNQQIILREEKYYLSAINDINETYNQEKPNWIALIIKLQKYAEECRDECDQIGKQSNLVSVLHGTVSYLVTLLENNYLWKKSLTEKKEPLQLYQNDPLYHEKVYELFRMFTRMSFEEYVDSTIAQSENKISLR